MSRCVRSTNSRSIGRAGRVVARTRSHGVPVRLPAHPVTAADVGEQVLALVARAQASGVDAGQAVRDAVRTLEADVRSFEAEAR